MFNNSHSKFINVNERPELIQKFNEYYSLSSSFEHKEYAVALQPSYFILYLLIDTI